MSLSKIITCIILLVLITGCAASQSGTATVDASPSPTPVDNWQRPTETGIQVTITAASSPSPEATQTEADLETPIPTQAPASSTPSATQPNLSAGEWKDLPIVPTVSDQARQIYRRGLELGRNPQAFSKVGDCGSTPAWFLGDFDRGKKYYQLGEFEELNEVIAYFQGSFERTSLAAKAGFSASSLLTPLWADRDHCQANEIPLECEYRVHNPSFALITLGTNDVHHAKSFESQMRKVIEFSIDNGILPILATKADNLEKDGSLNATIAQLAVEYELPLWNYWLAVQPLPGAGLQQDGAHITWGPNRFNDPNALKKGWTIRNLTALQVLDAVWRGVNE